jgi:hypothetical protein
MGLDISLEVVPVIGGAELLEKRCGLLVKQTIGPVQGFLGGGLGRTCHLIGFGYRAKPGNDAIEMESQSLKGIDLCQVSWCRLPPVDFNPIGLGLTADTALDGLLKGHPRLIQVAADPLKPGSIGDLSPGIGLRCAITGKLNGQSLKTGGAVGNVRIHGLYLRERWADDGQWSSRALLPPSGELLVG